jgi:hypothetical protein
MRAIFCWYHSARDFLLVPLRQFPALGQPVLEDHGPAVGVLVRKLDVDLAELQQPVAGVFGPGLRFGQSRVETVQRAGVDLQDEVVDVLEHEVQRTDGIADGGGHLAGAQALQPFRDDDILRGLERHLADFFAAVVASSRHLRYLRNAAGGAASKSN